MPNITLTITMTDTGQISVQGPIDQTILAFGMLEAAKLAIVAHGQEQQRRVQLASGPLVNQ